VGRTASATGWLIYPERAAA